MYCLANEVPQPINTWGRILQQYLDTVTLDLSKGRFFTEVFLALYFQKTRVRNVQFHNFLHLKSKKYLKSKLEIV